MRVKSWQETCRIGHWFLIMLLCLWILPGTAASAARLSEFLANVTPAEIFPGAERIGPPEGDPPLAPVYAGGRLLGHVYLNTDVTDATGYSGKPIHMLVAIDTDGVIRGVRLLDHKEPIVLIGIPEQRVVGAMNRLVGAAMAPIARGEARPPQADIVSGATVTVLVMADSVVRSAVRLIRAGRIGGSAPASAPAALAAPATLAPGPGEIRDWESLLGDGSIRRLHLSIGDVNDAYARSGNAAAAANAEPGDPDDTFIELFTALVSVPTIGKPLLDYFTYANLYQPCAALAGAATGSPGAGLIAFYASNRCTALKAKGLLSGATLQAQADEALQKLHSYGWAAEHDLYHASHHALATPSIVVTYLNTLGRFSVTDNVCGFSFATTVAAAGTTLGNVTATSAAVQAGIFASGNGVPPTAGINLVYNDASGGAKRDVLAVSPSTGLADGALDGALCARSLVTGTDPVSGAALTGTLAAQSERVRKGIAEVQATGALGGKPAVIVSGRSDTLIPVNQASRAYFGASRKADGNNSKLRYYEVTNAQHFDAFIDNAALPGYDSNLVPLHVYFNRAMDLMYAHLKNGAALPDSQVIHTTPRGGTPGSAPAISASNLPAIASTPGADKVISYSNGAVSVPD